MCIRDRGLAFLPKNDTYGTPWKWGSRQPAKSLNANMGIYISADTEYPEYVVSMIDYQYLDQMVELMNWGVDGVTYTKMCIRDRACTFLSGRRKLILCCFNILTISGRRPSGHFFEDLGKIKVIAVANLGGDEKDLSLIHI